jgi:hypothetical protein
MQGLSLNRLATNPGEDFDSLVKQTFARTIGHSYNRKFDFVIDFVIPNGSSLIFGSNRRPTDAVFNTRAIYRYHMLDDMVEMMVKLPMDIHEMHCVPENNWLLVVSKKKGDINRVFLIETEEKKIIYRFAVRAPFFKMVTKDRLPKVYYVKRATLFEMKMKNNNIKSRALVKFDSQIVDFDVMIAKKCVLILTERGQLLLYDLLISQVFVVGNANEAVKSFTLKEDENKITIQGYGSSYTYSLKKFRTRPKPKKKVPLPITKPQEKLGKPEEESQVREEKGEEVGFGGPKKEKFQKDSANTGGEKPAQNLDDTHIPDEQMLKDGPGNKQNAKPSLLRNNPLNKKRKNVVFGVTKRLTRVRNLTVNLFYAQGRLLKPVKIDDSLKRIQYFN